MIGLRIADIMLAAFSVVVLWIALRGLWRANRSPRAHGARDPIPLDSKSRLVMAAWSLGLLIGIALIAVSHS